MSITASMKNASGDSKDFIYNFYTSRRFNNTGCGGGAFGFDINYAEEVDYLIKNYQIKHFIETGTNSGDTIEFLAKHYPDLSILSCELNRLSFNFATTRLKDFKNITIQNISSNIFLDILNIDQKENNMYFLDAHWNDYWPLQDEIKLIEKGLILIDDFDIQYPGFSYDEYKGVKCDINYLKNAGITENVWINNPYAKYKYPMQNLNFKGGRAYICKNIDVALFNNQYFIRIL